MRRGAEAARRAHNPEVVGSNPTAATISFGTSAWKALSYSNGRAGRLSMKWFHAECSGPTTFIEAVSGVQSDETYDRFV